MTRIAITPSTIKSDPKRFVVFLAVIVVLNLILCAVCGRVVAKIGNTAVEEGGSKDGYENGKNGGPDDQEPSKQGDSTASDSESSSGNRSDGDAFEFSPEDWRDSDERRVGERRMLKIGNAKYGFVWIPAGEFDMGPSESEGETPRRVKLTKGFWMLETETTQALYQEIMRMNPSHFKGENLPVETVSWDDAIEFCKTLTKRLPAGLKATLPTEAQWEYACRAGTSTMYSYGDSPDSSKMNYGYHQNKTTLAVDYAANLWGLYDMHGNVREWQLDYPSGTATDPNRSKNVSIRIDRGGSWKGYARDCRSASRSESPADSRSSDLGFRFLISRAEPSDRDEKPTLEDQSIDADASSWSESSTREAGTRQTLKIRNEEYGFVWIPAGEFFMGSPESEKNRDDDEKLHRVKLTKGFWMLETETTQALYQEIMKTNPSGLKGKRLPVETVSWNDATKFCQELTKRLPKGMKATLPTEAQWEYACRAETNTAYSYGNSADSKKMNYDSTATEPAKSYAPNHWGLYDMHGNVWEWTSDYYAKDYPKETATDPKGPDVAVLRVERGGSWFNKLEGSCRSADRSRSVPDSRAGNLGFRFVLICD